MYTETFHGPKQVYNADDTHISMYKSVCLYVFVCIVAEFRLLFGFLSISHIYIYVYIYVYFFYK